MDKFWMLHPEGAGSPTHNHLTLAEAKAEAERLLSLSQKGIAKVYILEAVAVAARAVAPIVWET